MLSVEQLQISDEQNESGVTAKPPNVIIYAEDQRKDEVMNFLLQNIAVDSYAIYHINTDQVLKDPWQDNVALLVIAHENVIKPDVVKTFIDFVESGGTLISLYSDFNMLGKRQYSIGFQLVTVLFEWIGAISF